MSDTKIPWDEANLAEDPAVELLRQHLGYTYAAPEQLEVERQTSLKETVLSDRLARALKKLNPWLSESNVARAVKAIADVSAASLAEANEKLYVTLTYGLSLEQDLGSGTKGQTVRFFDFDEPGNNEFLVTRQYKVLGSRKHIILDVVVFVNGIPLVVVEAKSPTIGDKWKAEAVGQLRRYQEADSTWKDQGAPKLFDTAQARASRCSGWPSSSGATRRTSTRPSSSSPTAPSSTNRSRACSAPAASPTRSKRRACAICARSSPTRRARRCSPRSRSSRS